MVPDFLSLHVLLSHNFRFFPIPQSLNSMEGSLSILLLTLLPLLAFSTTLTLNEDTRVSFAIPSGCSSGSLSTFWTLSSAPTKGGVYKSSETSEVALPSGSSSDDAGFGGVAILEYRPIENFFGGKDLISFLMRVR